MTEPRTAVGRLAALIYRSQPADGGFPTLFGVTGTNGKTTTTYFINSLLRALGKKPGLIGTIEILAGGKPIPSLLTTPESTDVHALLALMRERGLDAASMEVSSHAISFHRVDGVLFDVAGFTNLTQDHLDLHGTMDEYFGTKAELFTAGRARHAVVTVDDEWGRKLAGTADIPVTTLATKPLRCRQPGCRLDGCVHHGARTGHGIRRSGTPTDGPCASTPACPAASTWPTQPWPPSWSWHPGWTTMTLQAALDAARPLHCGRSRTHAARFGRARRGC